MLGLQLNHVSNRGSWYLCQFIPVGQRQYKCQLSGLLRRQFIKNYDIASVNLVEVDPRLIVD